MDNNIVAKWDAFPTASGPVTRDRGLIVTDERTGNTYYCRDICTATAMTYGPGGDRYKIDWISNLCR